MFEIESNKIEEELGDSDENKGGKTDRNSMPFRSQTQIGNNNTAEVSRHTEQVKIKGLSLRLDSIDNMEFKNVKSVSPDKKKERELALLPLDPLILNKA